MDGTTSHSRIFFSVFIATIRTVPLRNQISQLKKKQRERKVGKVAKRARKALGSKKVITHLP